MKLTYGAHIGRKWMQKREGYVIHTSAIHAIVYIDGFMDSYSVKTEMMCYQQTGQLLWISRNAAWVLTKSSLINHYGS